MTVKINTALSLQRDMARYWLTDIGQGYAQGCAEVTTYANEPALLPEVWLDALDGAKLGAELSRRTVTASCYWTKNEMVELTLGASQLRPNDAIYYEDMPHLHGFVVFECPMLIDMGRPDASQLLDKDGELADGSKAALIEDVPSLNVVNLAGFQWNHRQVNGKPGIDVILYSDPKDPRDSWIASMGKGRMRGAFNMTPPLLVLGSFFIPYGESFAEDDGWHAIVATWLHLIMQPLTVSNVQQANPGMTKKAKKLDIKPDITVITLRPRKPTPREDTANHRIVNWTHRWPVGLEHGGTWRNQFYPSLGIHKRIFIQTYIKGPEGLPLIIKRQKLYAWRR